MIIQVGLASGVGNSLQLHAPDSSLTSFSAVSFSLSLSFCAVSRAASPAANLSDIAVALP